MRLGYRLSSIACDSRRNSGLKRMFLLWNFSRTDAVYPTGTVDLMTTAASGLHRVTSPMTSSTAAVWKRWVTSS